MKTASPRALSIANRKSQIANSLVLVQPIAQREIILAVNDAAKTHGIRPGMTLAEARALDAGVYYAQHDPQKDAVALEALARWMIRFTPNVTPSPCIQGEGWGLFLDLTGCDRALGGYENILNRVRESLDRFGISAHLAIAPNPGAAWAFTFSPAHQDAIVTETQLHDALLDLPPISLRLNPKIVASLHHLGLESIRQIVKLPRESLPARFGPDLLVPLDQAFGKIVELLIPLEPFSPIAARMDFDGAVDSLETIWIVFKKLIEKLVAELLKRGRGARTIGVDFFRAYDITLHQTIELSRPSRDPVNIFNLLRCAMESIETEEGFLGVGLSVITSQPITEEQIALLEHEEFAGQIELDHLIERLRIRMGQQVITQTVAVESYVPENAWNVSRATSPRVRRDSPARAGSPCYETIRPLHLLNHPEEILVTVTPSEDRDGKPVQFARCDGGIIHHLIHATGPERIAGQWWRGHNKTRDYFDVEDETGKRFWIFRVQETSKWFLHGEFE